MLQLICVGLFLVQGVASIPWILALNPYWLSQGERKKFFAILFGVLAAAGVVLGIFLNFNSDPNILSAWGRSYMAALHIQLILDFFVFAFVAQLYLWSKGGAVAMAAFQEEVRQAKFWLISAAGALLMFISVYIPYFTFGEDLKMVREMCFALTMIAPALFGVIAACVSVSDEIEGKTAVTLLSKPISRRQFLLGKYVGIILASLFMTLLLGWLLTWVVLLKNFYESSMPGVSVIEPAWPLNLSIELFGESSAGDLFHGIFLWCYDFIVNLPFLVIGFGQVMVLVAVGIALATRLPVVLNFSLCFLIYFLGHLTPILAEVSRDNPLIRFFANLFETILPILDLFDVGSAIIRELPPNAYDYSIYTLNVFLYAVMYTTVALLMGLIFFEDRDVA